MICQVCKKDYTMTAAGVMRKHTRSIWHGGSNYETLACEGGGKPARGITEAVVAIVKTGTSRFPARAFAAQQKAYAKVGLAWPPKWVVEARKKDDAWKNK